MTMIPYPPKSVSEPKQVIWAIYPGPEMNVTAVFPKSANKDSAFVQSTTFESHWPAYLIPLGYTLKFRK